MKEEKIKIYSSPVNYRVVGSGKPVILLHGWRSSVKSWASFQEKLAGEKRKVIIPDLPGFGKTPLPSSQGWPLNYYAQWVEKFIQELGKRGELDFPLTLIGHSFGGRIAIKLGAARKIPLDSIILIDAAGLIPPADFSKRIIAEIVKGGEIFLTAFYFPPRFKEYLRLLVYQIIRQKDYLKVSPEMRETFRKVIGEDLFSLLPEIDLPTLIIWGEKDTLLPLEQAFIFREQIPNSKLEIIPESGHSPHLETPDKLLSLIINFLQENE
jgi:pimeloyl-ACP methyl ester carboxylesterase